MTIGEGECLAVYGGEEVRRGKGRETETAGQRAVPRKRVGYIRWDIYGGIVGKVIYTPVLDMQSSSR